MEESEDMFKEEYENVFDKLQQHEIPALLHCIGDVLICQTSVIQMWCPGNGFLWKCTFFKACKGGINTHI